MAQSLFETLKQQVPNCTIDVLAPPWSQPLLERMPQVNNAFTIPINHGEVALTQRFKLGRSLTHNAYNQAIILPNSLKSALVPLWAKIPKRTGWRGEMRYGLLNDMRRLNKKHLPLMVQRFVALAYPKNTLSGPPHCPKPELTVNSHDAKHLRNRLKLTQSKPILALCPGAEFGPAKQWPVEYYAQIAEWKCKENYQVWLIGSPKDLATTNKIKKLIAKNHHSVVYNLAGKTKLGEAIDLLSEASLVISNDSGLMHIAAALHRPLTVIYGSTSPRFTPPLSDNNIFIKSTLDCSPCFKRHCPFNHSNCLKEILPEQVLAALKQLQFSQIENKTISRINCESTDS